MNKRKAIRILTKAAKLYQKNLEDQKILFIYGIPSEINKQLVHQEKNLDKLQFYETVFHRYNFQHLTGIRVSNKRISSAIQFYQMCLSDRLTEEDFKLSNDGSTVQKLEILEYMMSIKKNVAMIGDFTDRGPKLYSQKAAGGICGCIGFVQDKNTKLNVPNTLLNKDIRDVIAIPVQKVYAVFSKGYQEEQYSILEKIDKAIDIHTYRFNNQLNVMINWEKILEQQNVSPKQIK